MSNEPAPTASRRAAVALGVLGRGPGGLIDGAGTLSVGGVVVECWIGAQDRWHRPADEVAVRQDRLDGAPVVQTALRIPGGDARMTAYGAVLEGSDWIVLDVENASRTPFALALVSRTATAITTSAGGARWSLDGAVLRRDGQVLTMAARPADSWCGADTLDALAAQLGQAYDAADGSLPAPIGQTASNTVVAQVFAVSHGSALRVLIAPDDAGRPVPATAHPAAAPAPAAVARGWRRQLDAGTRCNLGDEVAETALLRRRADLLLDRSDTAIDPKAISALVAFGHDEEAAGRLDRLLASLRAPLDAAEAAAVLLAAADVVDWSPDGVELASLLAGPAVELAGWAARSAPSGAAIRPARSAPATPTPAEVAHWAVGRIAARAAAPGGGPRPAPAGPEMSRANGSANSIGGFRARPGHDDASGLLALRHSLVDDDLDGVLELLGGWEADWRGRSLDVHALPTVAGPLSFALRWHGPRPALLWQLEDGVPDPGAAVELRCSRLDPTFRSNKRQGEALLAEPTVAERSGSPSATGR